MDSRPDMGRRHGEKQANETMQVSHRKPTKYPSHHKQGKVPKRKETDGCETDNDSMGIKDDRRDKWTSTLCRVTTSVMLEPRKRK
jgi:hypothetical protein